LQVTLNIPDCLEKPLLFLVLLYRRLRYGCAFRRIPLTQGRFAIVDPEDYDRISRYKWHLNKGTHTCYAVRSLTNGKKEPRKNMRMHDLILNLPPDRYCDHINHNGLDNRKANLRPATRAQNIWHRRKFKSPSRSKFKGLCWMSKENRWLARITVNGQRLCLGSFENEIDAAKAYDRAAKQHFGAFAILNFPSSSS
jgi:hypothetical protein